MTFRYQPAARARRPAASTNASSRASGSATSRSGAPSPAAPTAKSIAIRLGWLDVADDHAARTSIASRRSAEAARDGGHRERSTCSAWAAAASAPKCCARSTACAEGSPGAASCSTRPTSARSPAPPARLDPRAHAGSSSPARAAARSKSRRWSASSGSACPRPLGDAAGPAVHRRHRSRHRARARWRPRAATARSFINPADIGGRFSALSLFGLVPTRADRRAGRAICSPAGADDGRRLPAGEPRERRARARRLHRRDAARRARQADGGAAAVARDARPVDRTAGRREHRQARQGRAAGRRRAARTARTNTAATARSSPSPPIATRPTRRGSPRSTRPAIRSCSLSTGSTGSAPSSSAGSSPPRSPARRWASIRSTSRTWRKRRTRPRRCSAACGATGRLPEPAPLAASDDVAVFTRAVRRRLAGGRRPRRARRRSQPRDYVAFLSYLPPDAATVERGRGDPRRDPRARHASRRTFGVGPRYLHSTGQYHKGGPEHRARLRDHGRRRDRDGDSGGGYSFSVLKRAQALGDYRRSRRTAAATVRIHFERRRRSRWPALWRSCSPDAT